MRFFLLICAALTCQVSLGQTAALRAGFKNPADSCKPGVYWYFMDGNMTASSITQDLEAMKTAGISHVLFLEVNVGVPRGPVEFFGPEWLRLFAHATLECKRLGIVMTLGIGPGWTGSGGPWVKGSQSMQHLVASETPISPGQQVTLKIPPPRKPFFGEDGLPDNFKKAWLDYYQDVAVLAIPATTQRIAHSDEKADYYRAPYSSAVVPPNIPDTPETAQPVDTVINLTGKMDANGVLHWTPTNGDWIVLRFGARNNGAITRPAPVPGLGFECDKFDTAALYAHLDAYVGKILKNSAPGVIQRLHMDSWEAGPQNWTARFRQEFIKRRGYDPRPYYPVYLGYAVGSDDKSARFLWDLRQTAQELILQNHATAVRTYAHRRGMQLSIEPYDMNPTSDLEYGRIADVPMAEFWSKGYGFNTAFSVIEATSIAHIEGHSLVQSESFTAGGEEAWKQHPASMKNQGDWALASGINLFFFHTFQNQFMPDSDKPGATMGPYGVHWDRSQTWWPMVGAYHTYLSRCGYLLRQGRTVADILYLTPEGSPNVFVPPVSALKGIDTIADRRGFNFDGCSPGELLSARVVGGRIVFPSGATYRVLVLPSVPSMTPRLLQKIVALSAAGATIIGTAPSRSPSLTDYPHCDAVVRALAAKLKLLPPGPLDGQLYPFYDAVADVLHKQGLNEDFSSKMLTNGSGTDGDWTEAPLRYTHRTGTGWDIYFVSNTTDTTVDAVAKFRTTVGAPEIWNAVTGAITREFNYGRNDSISLVHLSLASHESCFVVFAKEHTWPQSSAYDHSIRVPTQTLDTAWTVHFNPRWGGPATTHFDNLTDWTTNPDDGIRYYSGIATYQKTFDLTSTPEGPVFLDLGTVKNIARVRLNGKDLGVLWTAPWRVDISKIIKGKNNILEIDVANLWPNRLIGDAQPDAKHKYTHTTNPAYGAKDPLLPSGLLGPVTVITERFGN